MQFSEANELYQDIPEWVKFLIMFGVWWPREQLTKRRLALISMPCDSAAAGLIALGAMVRFLEKPEANDVAMHLQRIREAHDSILIYRKYPKWKFRYDGNDGRYDWIKQIKIPNNDHGRPPLRTILSFRDVRFQDEPFIENITGKELPYGIIYNSLTNNNCNILKDNLRKTDSSVCLAGRIMGESKTRDILSRLIFSNSEISISLDQLLSVHNWSQEKISRVSFFNTRTKKMDRGTAQPSLVVTDGDSAFLTVLDDRNLFSKSNIIATIDRTLERDKLEAITKKLQDMSQWYVRDDNYPEDTSVPKGISLAIWKER